ncbi:sporulation membrane protein YtaF [Neomoorella thermoacetica]|uniref:Manganese efflux pump MntP n=3 Tax=Neomoorella thermoacetica TaxID=1525 RepID=A0A1D7XCZ1_NEOTH|nr:sporulation membrane protein YtaF [Moorella thermoacetica]AKX97286.1 manganese efflux pump MntP [Moorella thermoacetica]AOQ24793.1 manganese efflux pump MntP [Moorella thermoacetica]APC09047.1 manganese efflux pump MntP [Moorella thermoacetica]OIQ09439.1 manganese efflux pump MntP [Moorella thermoacetica]OIQ12427.1 manganese efflux pump MntP [Moorella thermoacetica]
MFLATIFLALAVSLDGLGVGLAYGLRKIKLPWLSLVLVAMVSVVASFLSMAAGHLITMVFNPVLAGRLGAGILLTLGLVIILEAYLKREGAGAEEQTLLRFRLPRLGLVIQILKEPSRADRDLSGSISSQEALTLGLALALDALGTGIGAAAAGFSLFLAPLCIGLCQLLLVRAGLFLGEYWGLENLGWRGAAIPGLILIAIGLWRL